MHAPSDEFVADPRHSSLHARIRCGPAQVAADNWRDKSLITQL